MKSNRLFFGTALIALLASSVLGQTNAGRATFATPDTPATATETTLATDDNATADARATEVATPAATFTVTAPATLDLSGTPFAVMAALHAAGLVPAGGRELFDLPFGYALTSDPGFSFLPLGGHQKARDFVVNFQVIWYSAGNDSACGLSFHETDTGSGAVFLSNDGLVILTQQDGSQRILDYRQPSTLFSRKTVNRVTLIALGETLTLYINGQLETVAAGQSVSGGFSFEVYNALDNHTVTDCHYRHVWVWPLDSP